ncbi:hypothetical protein [Schleiferilactobacillus shenzhenensis]|uniref:DNA-directed RNA polymerase beta subunit n=1 Tax=Schleiferilactobacillus shenzhenensis LY-73 TaxID=1231336 RepID=U4TIM8_9LACO|nr:hypothetical protein [Schleiferilactobacillus shenzhenensis]ERL64671.1 hypothetical protein L248_0728 [Schleiferilactobacillus shenzhenensis LY-73]
MANIYDPPRSKWLYPDRGMVKWLGFFLSDHTKALEQDSETGEDVGVPQVQQDDAAIGELLDNAYLTGETAHIQRNILVRDHFQPDIVGTVAGFTPGNGVLLYTTAGAQTLAISDIRNIRLEPPAKWYRSEVNDYGLK